MAILHCDENFDFLLERLKICEIGFAKISTPTLRNFPEILSILAALLGSKFCKMMRIYSFDTWANLDFEEGLIRIAELLESISLLFR